MGRICHNAILFIVLGVLITPALHANLIEQGSLDCLIEPESVVEVSSPVNGIVDKMYVETSDIIKQGQALADLESLIEKANLDLAKVKADVNDEVTAKKINRRFAKNKMSRMRKLFKKNQPLLIKWKKRKQNWP